jgi:hypothetical protein
MKAWMLLKTIDRIKNESLYPTISMIINGLIRNLRGATSYLPHDSLWKSLEIASGTEQTNDVYDQQGISLNSAKLALLFSIGYLQENVESLCRDRPGTHDVHGEQGLKSGTHFF